VSNGNHFSSPFRTVMKRKCLFSWSHCTVLVPPFSSGTLRKATLSSVFPSLWTTAENIFVLPLPFLFYVPSGFVFPRGTQKRGSFLFFIPPFLSLQPRPHEPRNGIRFMVIPSSPLFPSFLLSLPVKREFARQRDITPRPFLSLSLTLFLCSARCIKCEVRTCMTAPSLPYSVCLMSVEKDLDHLPIFTISLHVRRPRRFSPLSLFPSLRENDYLDVSDISLFASLFFFF